jgi:hypothetical protein
MSVLSQPTPQISVGPPPTLTYQVSVTNGQAYTLTVFQTLNGTDTIVVSPTAYTGTGSLQTYTFTSPVTSYAYFTRVLIGSTTTNSTSILYYSPYQGPQGVQGNPGIQGAIGPGGQKGDQGPPGLQGIVSIDNYVTGNYLITSGSSSGKVNAHAVAVLDVAGALSGITTIQAGGGSSTIGSVTLNGGTINTTSTGSNKIGGVTLNNSALSGITTVTAGTGSSSIGGVTLNNGALSAASINNGAATFTVTSTTGTDLNTLTVGVGNGAGNAIYTTGKVNTGAITAPSINNGAATFTVKTPSGTATVNALTVEVGAGTTPGNAIYTTGNITAQDFIATSDRRLKSDIATICNAMDIVKGMRGVYFTRIGQSNRSTGVIAQEVEEVLPEVVHTSDDGMKSVSYGNVVGVLIEAVKLLSDRLEKMEAMK